MFRSLLVPLDGSPMAEAVLPAAARLAERLEAAVTLMHAIERDAPEAVHGRSHLRSAEDARAYLDDAAARAFPPALAVEHHVHRSEVTDVAASIADHARELADPLIVMCTHGRGGLGNLLLGNIAQRVVAAGTAPVLLVPPAEGGEPPPFDCSRLLVPLAGDREHEPGLPVAGDLAGACGGTIRLLRVVRTRGTLADGVAAAGRLLPRTAAAMLEMVRQEAGEYLDARVRELQAAGLAVATEVRRGDPAGEILQAARDDGASVIVMATHRRGGMTAFWQGSVAHRVASYAKRPVLLVPLLPGL